MAIKIEQPLPCIVLLGILHSRLNVTRKHLKNSKYQHLNLFFIDINIVTCYNICNDELR